jgi:hypothetical protein
MTDTPTPQVIADMQDPLPESNWVWRRVLTFMATLIIFGLMTGLAYAVHRIVGGVIGRIDNMSAEAVAAITVRALGVIERMFGWMYWCLLVVVTYYMVAPSAEQIAKMIGAVSLLKGGVGTASRTTVTDRDGKTEVASTTGIPPTPMVPPAEAAGPEDLTPPSQGGSGKKPTEILE